MNFRLVHQNLDTSFVNLSALIKYLRRRRFAGIIRVRLNNYEAEIHITAENQLNVRERDHLSGRVSEGEEALQRILIRSREPDGSINVFQKVSEKVSQEFNENKFVDKAVEISETQKTSETKEVSAENKSVVQSPVKTQPTKPVHLTQPETPKIEMPAKKPEVSLPDFPFRLSNNVEARAKQTKISAENFQTLVRLFAEILGTIDTSLAAANLNFSAAFSKACAEISGDYPFLKSEENVFRYDKGS